MTPKRTQRPAAGEALIDDFRVAEWLGITPWGVRRWRQRGRGPRFIRVGGRIRYQPSDVRAWIEANASKGAR